MEAKEVFVKGDWGWFLGIEFPGDCTMLRGGRYRRLGGDCRRRIDHVVGFGRMRFWAADWSSCSAWDGIGIVVVLALVLVLDWLWRGARDARSRRSVLNGLQRRSRWLLWCSASLCNGRCRRDIARDADETLNCQT